MKKLAQRYYTVLIFYILFLRGIWPRGNDGIIKWLDTGDTGGVASSFLKI